MSGIPRPCGPAWGAARAPEGGTPNGAGPGCARGRGSLRRAADAAEGEKSRTGGSPSLPSWVGSALPRGPICPAGRCPRGGEKSRTGGSPSLPSWVGSALPRGPVCPAGLAQGASTSREQLPSSATTDPWVKISHPTHRPCSASASIAPTSSGTPTGTHPLTTPTVRHFRSPPSFFQDGALAIYTAVRMPAQEVESHEPPSPADRAHGTERNGAGGRAVRCPVRSMDRAEESYG